MFVFYQSVSRGSSRAQSPQPGGSLHPSPCHTRSPSLTAKPYTLNAKIIDTGELILQHMH